MANKLYTEDIDKTVDWGSAGPEGLPVSGEKVQKFIKETLDNKWGYLYYDKQSNKYYVFADEADFDVWVKNRVDNQILVKATFDAPAPATVVITADGTSGTSSKINTILFEDIVNTKISFKYRITDSTGNPLDENSVSIAVSITNSNGVKSMPTQLLNALTNFVDADKNLLYTINDISNYLNEGTNTVRVTVTSTSTNVSSTAIFQYQVMNLIIESDFSDKSINLDDESGIFSFNILAKGTGQKFLRMFVGNADNSVLTNICSNIVGTPAEEDANLYIGANNPQDYQVNIQWNNSQTGSRYSWATPGKHTLQMYFFIESNGEMIKSQTLYYEFVLVDNTLEHTSYILFNRTLDQGQLVDSENRLEISVNQYGQMSVDYSVYDTRNSGNVDNNSAIGIELTLNKIEGSTETELYSTLASVTSGNSSTFNYQINTYTEGDDYMTLVIHNTMTNSNNEPCGETAVVYINVNKAAYQIGDRTASNLILELSAKNRSNSEPANIRKKWEYIYKYQGTDLTVKYDSFFNDKVLWNDNQNGWINNALVLNNGATVTVNFDIFYQWNNNNGLTFEIDFETADVQDDTAPIMKYGAIENGQYSGSYFEIQACKAISTSNNGTKLETSYKDGSRQKIQFIFNPNVEDTSHESPCLMYLVVNGILDRAALFSPTDSVNSNGNLASFTIGNTEGTVTTKIYSIRVYNKALTLDQCVDNYIADSDKIIETYKKNNIFTELEGGATSTDIDITKVKNILPTMIIYGNPMDSIVKVFDKKANVPVDILYTDPDNPNFNFFALNVWLSNQGTSSMYYPRRNFRPYFNKEADTKTMYGYAPKDKYKYETRVYQGLTDLDMIARIQAGDPTLDLDKIIVNDRTYIPACNKKTLKKKFKPIDKNVARNLWHGRFKVLVSEADVNALDDNAKTTVSKVLKSAKNGYQEIKKNLNLVIDSGLQLYSNASYARFKSKDMYTDRWTLKCDYAESSMTHNAGIGRLWNDVMKNVDLGTAGFVYETEFDQDGNPVEKRIAIPNACSTKAQRLVDEYVATKPKDGDEDYVYGDIRTSCDGKPIVIFNYAREMDANGAYTGDFGEIQFLGLYNIMTDKGSTPLFGFETLRKDEVDESGSDTLFDASKVECWECLQNGSQIAQMSDIVTDSPSLDGATVAWTTEYEDGEPVKETGSDNEDRLIFASYEARWPDNDDLNETHTNNLETVIRFVNFCIPSVTVEVDGKNGYNLIDFTPLGTTKEESEANAEKLSRYIGRKRSSLTYEDIETLSPILNLGVSTPEEIEDLLASDDYLNNSLDVVPNNTLYLQVPSKSYKNKSDKFYYTYIKGDENHTYASKAQEGQELEILYDDETGRVVYIGVSSQTTEEMTQLENLAKKSVYFYQTYKTGDVARKSFDPLYDASDDLAIKVSAIVNALKNDSSVYTEEEDDSTFDYIEQPFDENMSGYFWCRFDNSYNRTKVVKEINNTTIDSINGVRTVRLETFDAKRYRINPDNGERIENIDRNDYNDLLTTVYVTKESSKDMYVNEFGQKVQVPSRFINDIKEEGYKGARLFDYFKDKKYEHFDIWKLAAYYVYLMRFAAVDQVIKNTMMTTEDGRHYYFINYDNDTINGVRNDGYLAYNWDVTRETYDFSIGGYAYAGFGSGLWNLLEQDSDFMEKVQTVANAMVTSKVLTYNIAINMFNVLQSGTWGQRLYNKSEQFKYIDTFIGDNEYSNTKYLPFLQGSRTSHREWWLRHRFDLYDSMWKAGEFGTNNITFYIDITASQSNPVETFKIVSGSTFYYCWLDDHNDVFSDNFFELKNGEEHVFISRRNNVGQSQPCRLLGFQKASIIDFSNVRSGLVSSMVFNYGNGDEKIVPLIKKLIYGGDRPYSNEDKCRLVNIGGLELLTGLEELDIRTCDQLQTLDISTLGNLKKFLATDSSLKAFIPYPGLIFDEVSLPTTLTTLNINGCIFNEVDGKSGFKYSPNSALTSINIIDCKGIDLVQFLKSWYSDIKSIPGINMQRYSCTLSFDEITIPKEIEINGQTITGVEWINNLRTEFGIDSNGNTRFNIIKGVINILGSGANDSITENEYNSLKEAWGDNFFDATKVAHFNGTAAAFISFVPKDEDAWNLTSVSDTEIQGTIIAGQHLDIKITMFPVNNDRKITITPYYISTANNSATKWSKDIQGRYYHAYTGRLKEESYISTDLQGNTSIDLYYYENLTEPYNQLWFKIDSNIESDTNFANTIKINIDNIIRPGRLIFNNQLGNEIEYQTINTSENYVFDLVFSNQNTNLKIDNPYALFDGTDSNENSEYGSLNVEYNEDKKLYQLIYSPKITKNDTSVVADVVVPFISGTSDEGTSSNPLVRKVNVSINNKLTLNIDTINIGKLEISNIKGETVTKLEGTEKVIDNITYNVITFENHVNSVNGNIKYNFEVNVLDEYGASNHNVEIKNMTIAPDGFAVNPSFNKSDGVITDFAFTITPNRVGNEYISGEFEGAFIIELTNEFDDVIYTRFEYKVKCYLPDKIKVTRLKDGYYTDDLTTDLLNGNNYGTYAAIYHANICSTIQGKDFIWGGEEENSIPEKYLPENITSYTKLKLNDASENNALSVLEGNSESSSLENYCLEYRLKLLENAEYVQINAYFTASVTIGSKTTSLNAGTTPEELFSISYSSASAANWDYTNLTIDNDNPNNNIYYIDKFGRFFKSGAELGNAQDLWDSSEVSNNILFIGYLYADENAIKKMVVFDPWLLASKGKCIWYLASSTFAKDEENGISFVLNTGDVKLNKLARYKYNLDDGVSIWDNNKLTFSSNAENKLFNLMYDYYRIVSGMANSNTNNGGSWEVRTYNKLDGSDILWDGSEGHTISNLLDYLLMQNQYYNEDARNARNSIELNIRTKGDSSFNVVKKINDVDKNVDMIFFIYDYYSKFGINKKGRLLTHNEISIIIQNKDYINDYINELYRLSDEPLYHYYDNALMQNLIFDEDKYGYDVRTYNPSPSDKAFDNWCTDNSSNDVIGKFFWNLNCMTYTQSKESIKMPTTYVTECEMENDGIYKNGDIVIQYNDNQIEDGRLSGGAFTELYCMFGPQI